MASQPRFESIRVDHYSDNAFQPPLDSTETASRILETTGVLNKIPRPPHEVVHQKIENATFVIEKVCSNAVDLLAHTFSTQRVFHPSQPVDDPNLQIDHALVGQLSQNYAYQDQIRRDRQMSQAMGSISSQNRRPAIQSQPAKSSNLSHAYPDFDPMYEQNAAEKQRQFLEECKIAICESRSPKFAAIRQKIKNEKELIGHAKVVLKTILGFPQCFPPQISKEIEDELEASIKKIINKWKAEDSNRKKFMFFKKARPKGSHREDVQTLCDYLTAKLGNMYQAHSHEATVVLEEAFDDSANPSQPVYKPDLQIDDSRRPAIQSSSQPSKPSNLNHVFPDFDPMYEQNAAEKQRQFLEECKIAICESGSPKFAAIRQKIKNEKELIGHAKVVLKTILGFPQCSPPQISKEIEDELEASIKKIINKWKAEDSNRKKFIFFKKARAKGSYREDVQTLCDYLTAKLGNIYQAHSHEEVKSESPQNRDDEEMAIFLKEVQASHVMSAGRNRKVSTANTTIPKILPSIMDPTSDQSGSGHPPLNPWPSHCLSQSP